MLDLRLLEGYTYPASAPRTPKRVPTKRRPRTINTNNTTGITGVAYNITKKTFHAYAYLDGKLIYLHSSKDFFEACCARKSFDARKENGNQPNQNGR